MAGEGSICHQEEDCLSQEGSHGGRNRLNQRLEVQRVADQFDRSGWCVWMWWEHGWGVDDHAEGPGGQGEGWSGG